MKFEHLPSVNLVWHDLKLQHGSSNIVGIEEPFRLNVVCPRESLCQAFLHSWHFYHKHAIKELSVTCEIQLFVNVLCSTYTSINLTELSSASYFSSATCAAAITCG